MLIKNITSVHLLLVCLFQINLTCKESNIDLNIKNILDDVQIIRDKFSTIESSVNCSDKVNILVLLQN